MSKRHRIFWIIISVITILGMIFAFSPGVLTGTY